MGFCHDIDSDILIIESRRESLRLKTPEHETHIFAPCLDRRKKTRNEIADMLMERAQELFANGKDEDARMWRNAAKLVANIPFDREPRPKSVEITKAYLRELMLWFEANPDILAINENVREIALPRLRGQDDE